MYGKDYFYINSGLGLMCNNILKVLKVRNSCVWGGISKLWFSNLYQSCTKSDR